MEKDLKTTSNESLMALLDDLVQALSGKNNEEWAKDRSQPHKDFVEIKKEIYNRLK